MLSSILVHSIATPSPVRAADGRTHLAYELLVVNASALVVTLQGVRVLAPDDATLQRLGSVALARRTRVHGRGRGTTLAPGASAAVVMDVAFDAGTLLPRTLRHELAIARARPGRNGSAARPLPASAPVAPRATFVGAATRVDPTPAVVLAPPLRGGSWLVVNGYGATLTSHRGAILAIDGEALVAERFAIDFVRLDAHGRLTCGPADRLASYAYLGVPIHSVAEGNVVDCDDGRPEAVPGAPPRGASPATAGGNFVVVDIGDGRHAFYAHMRPGSVRVRRGDRVGPGEVIGLLGNSGNTTAPHLHFHVMDGRDPLASNGLPYAFASFVGEGAIDGKRRRALFARSVPAIVDRARWAGPHANELPLDDMIVRFPD